jgi:hypothetical protein
MVLCAEFICPSTGNQNKYLTIIVKARAINKDKSRSWTSHAFEEINNLSAEEINLSSHAVVLSMLL